MSDDRGSRRLALFPASFDPVTNGHLDLIERAHARVRRTGGRGRAKRREAGHVLGRGAHRDAPGGGGRTCRAIRITAFDGLLVDYARHIGAHVLLRGLRAVSDFEYEFEMALMNRHLYPEIETLFMMTSQKYFYVSSSRLKELVRFGANVTEFVPPAVALKLKEKLGGGGA